MPSHEHFSNETAHSHLPDSFVSLLSADLGKKEDITGLPQM